MYICIENYCERGLRKHSEPPLKLSISLRITIHRESDAEPVRGDSW